MSLIELKKVSKFYYNKQNISSGITSVSLKLDMGEFAIITGESGSGKSTLLNVISGLDSYEEGELYINGEETSHYTETDYEIYRRKYIGNIFQNFNLVNSYTVFQNVELVLLLNGYSKKDAKIRVLEILSKTGLSKLKNRKVSKLSGGQKQRVAIARALAKDTPIIIADEPTGNLDVKSAKEVFKLLNSISKEKLIVVVTHNYEQVEEYATRKITMHDGKITEDKVLKETKTVKLEEVKTSEISLFNKIRLSFRNAFNVKTKFLLLFMVYFFLAVSIFSEYTSIKKINFDSEEYGYNYYFVDTNPKRVILNKLDKTPFTEEELEKLSTLDNVSTLIENDTNLDTTYSLYNDEVGIYFDGNIFDYKEITSVDVGLLPTNENEVVILGNKEDYIFDYYEDEILSSSFTLNNDNTVKIVGIIYDDSISVYSYKIYVNSNILNTLRKENNISYSEITLSLNNKLFDEINIVPSKKVNKGEAFIYESINYEFENYNALYKNLTLNIKNIYYEDNITLKVSKLYNQDNFKSITGLKNYDNYYNTIFINEDEYDDLFNKDTYQVSIFLKDVKNADTTVSTLKEMGYRTFYMRNALASTLGEINGFIVLFRKIVFIIAAVILFFIAYFIIKIILKSRNVYFSIVRILGATKKNASSLLNKELFIDINVAYLVCLLLIIPVKYGFISIEFVQDMITYLSIKDFIFVYIVLVIMSLLISNRYSNSLFNKSAMKAYREEV